MQSDTKTVSTALRKGVAAAQLAGAWKGHIGSYTGAVPVTITISRSGDVHGNVGNEPDGRMRNVSIEGEHVYSLG